MKQRIYTFKNFAIGKANQLAYLSIKRTIRNPGGDINPLFIYAENGLGKTHLITAAMESLKHLKVQCWDCGEEEAVPEPEGDVLICEDLHLLTDEVRKGLPLYNFIKSFIVKKHQVYITSVFPPEYLKLSEKLFSLVKSGLVIPIFKPNKELLKKILLMQCADYDIELNNDVIDFLSSQPLKDGNDIETVLKKIDLLLDVTKNITVEDIRENISLDDILSPKEIAGQDSEFFDFVKGLKEDIGGVTTNEKNLELMKEEYREKMYIWKMKGFNISRLQKAMKGPIDGIIQAFVSFTSDIQRLVELQKRYGELESLMTPQEKQYFEEVLFDPDAVVNIIEKLNRVEERKRQQEEYSKFLDNSFNTKNFVVLPSNRNAVEALRNAVVHIEKSRYPIYIHGDFGSGKTHLLMAFARRMQLQYPSKIVSYIPAKFFPFELKNISSDASLKKYIKKLEEIDVLYLDDINELFSDSNATTLLVNILKDFTKKAKPLIMTSTIPVENLNLDSDSLSLLSSGTIVQIGRLEVKDIAVIITNLFARKRIRIPDDIRDFIAENVTGNFNAIKKIVEKLNKDIFDKNIKPTVENIGECLGLTGKTLKDATVAQMVTQKRISPEDFDLRWPDLKDRIFEDYSL